MRDGTRTEIEQLELISNCDLNILMVKERFIEKDSNRRFDKLVKRNNNYL